MTEERFHIELVIVEMLDQLVNELNNNHAENQHQSRAKIS